ncbi:MAG: adenylate/guanylate cyclase domain-containing protein, partial [Elusimicrobia bacterium]|nr:adenylate/guanylate cyclase domain-containing protein [Elusimicrobiota bacterium]
RLGQWPWPRTQVARLERRLQELGASATVYDIFFSEPDRTSPRRIAATWPSTPEFAALRDRVSSLPDHDALLAKTLKKGRAVLGYTLVHGRNDVAPASKAAFSFGGDGPLNYALAFQGAVVNLPELEAAAAGLANVGFPPDPDQVIRTVPLLYNLRGRLFPALSIEGLRVAQGATAFMVKSSGASGEGSAGQRTGIVALKVGEFTIPTDEHGRLRVYYTRTAPGRTIPAWTLFEKGFDRAAVEGSICLIGTSAAGLKDLRVTPLNPAAAGVEVHANVMEQIVTQSFLARPDWALGAELTYLLVLGLLLLAVLARGGAFWAGPAALAAVAASLALSWHAFTAWRWLLDPVLPSLGLVAVYATWSAVGFVRTEADKRRITDTFGRYLSPKVVENLAKNPGAVQLGGETREMTFHFCDIRGFTTISEKFDPHGLTVFINNFLTPMTQIILEHDGTIDKYIGDCIMAFWNAPVSVPDHARRACEAALKMHESLAALNARWQAEAKAKGIALPLIEIGTGLNTGPAVVGNMGSTLRVDYTVLGDDVNLASRLESQSKTYGVRIVIGPLTRERTPDFAAIELDLIKVKGKTRPVNIHALLGDPAAAKSAPFLALAAKHAEFLKVYRSARFEEAEKLMAEARVLGEPWRLGKLYDLYAERLAAFRVSPPDPSWNGVFTATSK